MSARPYKSLVRKKEIEGESGHAHREHRSKKGRTSLARKKANSLYKKKLEAIKLKELEREQRRVVQ